MRSIPSIVSCLALSAMLGRAAYAAAPAELLEKAIYAEESAGDLATAMKLYREISAAADAERPTAATALLRLGMCYLKGGQGDEAATTFQKLAKEYPEQKALLARIPALPPPLLALARTPWETGEVLVLQVKTAGSTEGTVMVFRATEVERAGRAVWHLETFRPWMGMFTSVDVDAATFQPIAARSLMGMTGTRAEAAYSPTRIDVTQWEGAEPRKQQIPLTRTVYDNEQIIPMIRRLPLADGFTVTLPVLGIGTPVIPEVKITVIGRETLTVAAGTFETFKMNLGIYMEGRHIQDQKIWYSTDEHRYPVKIDNVAVLELSEVRTGTPTEATSFDDAETRASLTAPAEWLLAKSPATKGELRLDLFAPELKARGSFKVGPLSTGDAAKTAAQIAADHVEWSRKQYKVYTLRRETPEAVSLGGVAAARLEADFTHRVTGRSMVESHAFLVHGERRVTLRFETEKEQWDVLKPAIDGIMSSVRLR